MLFGHIHLYLCCFQTSRISWFLRQELPWLAFSNSVSFRVNLLLSMCISKILSHLIQSFMKMNLELNFPPGLLSHVSIIFLYAFSTQSWNHFGHHGKWNMYLVTKILTVLLFTGWCNYLGCWLPCLLQLIALFSVELYQLICFTGYIHREKSFLKMYSGTSERTLFLWNLRLRFATDNFCKFMVIWVTVF